MSRAGRGPNRCWPSLAALILLLRSSSVFAAPAADYEPWRPGGQRVTVDGITFDSTIPCGNGHDFRKVGPGHYRFHARVGREPYTWRFYFKIECPDSIGREIVLEVADFNHAGRTVFHEGATVWSADDRQWTALGPQRIEIAPYTRTGLADLDARYGDRTHVPYGVRYHLRLVAPQMWFAVPAPYTLQRRDKLLTRLAADYPQFVQLLTVGQSRHSREHGYAIRAVRIAEPGENPRRRNLVVIAGEHSAESAGIYACEGWIEEVLAHRDWLDRYAFYFVPIVNVDGVYYGASYYNLPATLTEGVGENLSVGWQERTLPEVQALWPLLVQWRPLFFASLHNGRHRTELEALGPPGAATNVLLQAWRRELGFPFEKITNRGVSRAWNVLSSSGITPLAYTIETLSLVRQNGSTSFPDSYIQTGRQLARGTVTALDSLPSAAPRPAPVQGPCLRLSGEDFTAQLPWFYHGLAFDHAQPHDIYSFEANALELPPGLYTVALLVRGNRASLEVSFNGSRFEEMAVRDGRVELPSVSIPNRMLSLYVKASGASEAGPLESAFIYPAGTPFASAHEAAVPYAPYRRDIRLRDREILQPDSWDEFYSLLCRDTFGKRELRAMFHDLLAWCCRRQLLDPADVHYGAIYSEEDKYDFCDAAAAAVSFAHAWRDTGDEDYRRRALLARAYAWKGQHREDPTNKLEYGGFCQMVDGRWGTSFKRLGGPLPKVSGVETCIIANLTVKTFELGLEPSPVDVENLKLAATWVANNEFQPGVFHHHEGSTTDCQNSNMLGAMALARISQALEKLGQQPPSVWLEASRRGMRHYMEGQEAIGCWPYLFASIGRGQAFGEENIPDQGMGVYHFLAACRTPAFQEEPDVRDRMERAARWWLAMSRIDRQGPRPTIDLDDCQARGDLKFSAFTWCRFMAAASLLRIAEATGQPEPWRHLALRYMEHVRTKLWNRTDPNTAPVRRATRENMTLCSWIQAAEWDAALLRDMEEHLP